MIETEAVSIADSARRRFNVPAEYTLVGVQRKIIELVGADPQLSEAPPAPGLVRDAVAWLVTFGAGAVGIELAVDENTGSVIRVRRTASARHIPFNIEGLEP